MFQFQISVSVSGVFRFQIWVFYGLSEGEKRKFEF